MAHRVLNCCRVSALIAYLVVGLAVGFAAWLVAGRHSSLRSGSSKRWSEGLLASDHRSFDTISKQHRRSP